MDTNNLLQKAQLIPVCEPNQTLSIAPILLNDATRPLPLQVRITVPTTGENIPIIVLAHGMGPSLYIQSLHAYQPLAIFWASHGFAVLQCSLASSKVHGYPKGSVGAPMFWRQKVAEIKLILDNLDYIEQEAKIRGRLDRNKIAAAGHSAGGQLVSILLGATQEGAGDLKDSRIKVGVLLGSPGSAKDMSNWAKENIPDLCPSLTTMTTRALVVAGDEDVNLHLHNGGPEWHMDPFYESPGADTLLLLKGGKHGFGGIASWDAKETDDEDPDRLALTQRLTWAYIRSALDGQDPAWQQASDALKIHASDLAEIRLK